MQGKILTVKFKDKDNFAASFYFKRSPRYSGVATYNFDTPCTFITVTLYNIYVTLLLECKSRYKYYF